MSDSKSTVKLVSAAIIAVGVATLCAMLLLNQKMLLDRNKSRLTYSAAEAWCIEFQKRNPTLDVPHLPEPPTDK